MSYIVNVKIDRITLIIPKGDFPLKSNSIIGYQFPELKYQDDECSFGVEELFDNTNSWLLEMENFHCWESELFDDLIKLIIKYKGTLIATLSGEDADDVSYIRIRDGVKKKVKITEE